MFSYQDIQNEAFAPAVLSRSFVLDMLKSLR